MVVWFSRGSAQRWSRAEPGTEFLRSSQIRRSDRPANVAYRRKENEGPPIFSDGFFIRRLRDLLERISFFLLLYQAGMDFLKQKVKGRC